MTITGKGTKIAVGNTYKTKSFGECIVVEYVSASEVIVKFSESGFITKVSAGNLRNGFVRDLLARTVHGVGYLGGSEFKSRHPNNGPCTKEYATWSGMMHRCYGQGRDASTLRVYADCSVSPEWYNFQAFAQWCQSQVGMRLKDASLDKDILVKGNRVYSPETCCFVPVVINTAVTGIKHTNTTGMSGVWKFRDSYVSEATIFSVKAGMGMFDNPEDAAYMYREVKNAYIRALAEVYKSSISPKVYNKLKEWCCDNSTI